MVNKKVYIIIVFDADTGKHLSRTCYRSWSDVNRFMVGFNPDAGNLALEITSMDVGDFINE